MIRYAALLVLLVTLQAQAVLRPAEVFSDHMVLQQGMPAPVWGTADAGQKITVTFAGQTRTATADESGKWMSRLDALAASDQPRELTITADDEKLTIKSVLVGEVWLCSGQSNMYFALGKIGNMPGYVSEDELKQISDDKLILKCDPDHPFNGGAWKPCDPDSVRGFSATAYYFGARLRKELDVPVGLINASRGGTHALQWMPEDVALSIPVVKKYHEIFLARRKEIETFNRGLVAFVNKKTTTRPAPLPRELETARSFHSPGKLWANYIAPLAPYAIKGAIWYQGESDAVELEVAEQYEQMLARLIASWRSAWGQGDFPFYFVQLPCWTPAGPWAEVRNQMLRAYRSVPNTGMVVMVDTGDVDNLHPATKLEAGTRLANWALAKQYGKPVEFTGPLFKAMKIDGDKAIVSFEPDGGGLVAKGALNDFEIAGDDGVFVSADAKIDGSVLIVSSPKVPHPAAVRYGSKAAFSPTLFGADGLAGSPFSATARP